MQTDGAYNHTLASLRGRQQCTEILSHKAEEQQ